MERFETIVDGSDAAKRFCYEFLEPAVDALYKESFRKHDAERTVFERTEFYSDEESLSCKLDVLKSFRKNGGVLLSFSLEVSQQRLLEPGEYCPHEYDESGKDIVYAGFVFDDDNEDDEDDEADWDDDYRMIVEVWHYLFDEDGYLPRKDVRFEYYTLDGVLEGMICSSNADTKNKMLDENVDIEIDLQIKDACLSQTFSEQDVREIIGAIARLGFQSDFSVK